MAESWTHGGVHFSYPEVLTVGYSSQKEHLITTQEFDPSPDDPHKKDVHVKSVIVFWNLENLVISLLLLLLLFI